MPEVPDAGEDHRDVALVRGRDHFVVAHRSAGLDDARGTDVDDDVEAVASDAFFPFRDGLDVVVDAGASCVIQPGGSLRDAEVIAAADERGVAMVLTGVRHFRH